MNQVSGQEWNAGWEIPTSTRRDMSMEEFEEFIAVNRDVLAFVQEHRLTRADIASRSGIPGGTLYDFLKGHYRGVYSNITKKLREWLTAEAEAAAQRQIIIKAPDYIKTPTSRLVTNALVYAQTAPSIVLITLGAGVGKTTTVEQFASTRPGVTLATMRWSIQRPASMMLEIARVLDIHERYAPKRMIEIGRRIKRNGRHTLLILDEAQFLSDDSINELRYLKDMHGVGIALLGNEDLNQRYGGHAPRDGYGQLHSRIGMRIRRLKPEPDDIAMYIAGWGITDPEAIQLLTAIAHKPGALRQVEETIKLAAVMGGSEKTLTANDIRMAWRNRGGENL
jgi:Uncharacterized ATPase, putative transposase